MRRYVAILEAYFEAETDVDALLIAEVTRENAGRDLDADADDSIEVVAVIPQTLRIFKMDRLLRKMRDVRDELIRTKITQCVDLARELDRQAFILENRIDEHFDAGTYDYGAFIQLMKEVLDAEH